MPQDASKKHNPSVYAFIEFLESWTFDVNQLHGWELQYLSPYLHPAGKVSRGSPYEREPEAAEERSIVGGQAA